MPAPGAANSCGMQNAGHINIESGHGDWPLGLALLQSLTDEPTALMAGRPQFRTIGNP